MTKFRAASIGAGIAGAAVVLTAFVQPADAATTYVGLFQNTNFGGCAYYLNVYANVPDFSKVKYDDQLPSGGADPACDNKYINDRTSSVSTLCKIRLYTDANYKGSSQEFTRGTYKSVKYNDRFSSLKIESC